MKTDTTAGMTFISFSQVKQEDFDRMVPLMNEIERNKSLFMEREYDRGTILFEDDGKPVVLHLLTIAREAKMLPFPVGEKGEFV